MVTTRRQPGLWRVGGRSHPEEEAENDVWTKFMIGPPETKKIHLKDALLPSLLYHGDFNLTLIRGVKI